jgi:hypothetical protein
MLKWKLYDENKSNHADAKGTVAVLKTLEFGVCSLDTTMAFP